MRMSANEFLDITRWMSEAEYAEFVEYASNEPEEPEWLSEYREDAEHDPVYEVVVGRVLSDMRGEEDD